MLFKCQTANSLQNIFQLYMFFKLNIAHQSSHLYWYLVELFRSLPAFLVAFFRLKSDALFILSSTSKSSSKERFLFCICHSSLICIYACAAIIHGLFIWKSSSNIGKICLDFPSAEGNKVITLSLKRFCNMIYIVFPVLASVQEEDSKFVIFFCEKISYLS